MLVTIYLLLSLPSLNLNTIAIKELHNIDNKILIIEGLLSCGSRENLSASLLSEFIKTHVKGIKEDAFVDIKRVEMYAFKGKELLTLQEYFAQY